MRRFLLPCLLLLTACGDRSGAPAPELERAEVSYVASAWPLPVDASAAQPDLVDAGDGRLLLSWVEAGRPGTHALKFASFDGKAWSPAQEIARGQDWFVNWADTPHLVATADGALWAHWLRQSAKAAYAYDVVLTRSADGGAHWAPPMKVNSDDTPTEHGFVSLWPQSRETIGVAWLDGRATSGGSHAGHAGAMALRVAYLDAGLRKSSEIELDPRACDCCQTAAAMTTRGPLLAYRDRDGDEVRDIVTARFEKGAWTLPRKVNDDRWRMPACPVNGPAIAARGNEAWVAWYTATGDRPRVRIARSQDAGDSFSTPVEVDGGLDVQGRVGIAVDGEDAWIHWTREEAGGQSLWLARYRADLGSEVQRLRVAGLEGRGRATGFPQMAMLDGVAYLAWTDVVDGKPALRGARVSAAPPAR